MRVIQEEQEREQATAVMVASPSISASGKESGGAVPGSVDPDGSELDGAGIPEDGSGPVDPGELPAPQNLVGTVRIKEFTEKSHVQVNFIDGGFFYRISVV